jgi:hypothetical protein
MDLEVFLAEWQRVSGNRTYRPTCRGLVALWGNGRDNVTIEAEIK